MVLVLGSTVLSWQGVFATLIGELAGVEQSGTALGAVNTVTRVSMIMIPPLFGLIVDVSDSYSIGWLVVAATALVCTLGLVVFGREPHR